MANITIANVISRVRDNIIETTPNFWGDEELSQHVIAGVKDLWRDIVDLKQEHYLVANNTDVYYPSNSTQLAGVPVDVHKIYQIEPRDLSQNSANVGLQFVPLEYNDRTFQSSRSMDSIDPTNAMIYYEITGQGSPVNAPTILCAPKVNSTVNLSFVYIPTLPNLTTTSPVPIPGEAGNALFAWTMALARAKERDDRSPDPNWLAIYATEKQHLLQSLGLRQYQDPLYVNAMFENYWG